MRDNQLLNPLTFCENEVKIAFKSMLLKLSVSCVLQFFLLSSSSMSFSVSSVSPDFSMHLTAFCVRSVPGSVLVGVLVVKRTLQVVALGFCDTAVCFVR